MSVLLVETYLAFGASLMAMLANLIRASRGGARRHHYAATGIVAAYVAIIYGLALIGILDLRNIGPDYLRLANILIMGSLAANAIAHWRESESGE